MLGLKGQHLGLVREAKLDTCSGAVTELVLETRWQLIEVPWSRVAFDEHEDVFKMKDRRYDGH